MVARTIVPTNSHHNHFHFAVSSSAAISGYAGKVQEK